MSEMHQFRVSPMFKILVFVLFSLANAETIEVRDALVEFMRNLNPGNSQNQANWGWNGSSDPCSDSWSGVSCYNNTLTVKKIVLDELDFTGTLDTRSLCVTQALTVLSLNSNNVAGTFSEEIVNCTRLTHIYLHGNRLSGNLPSSLSGLGNLKRLDVSDNGFSGSIPDLSRISGLLSVLVEDNQLTGAIPDFDFSNLEEFNVSNNNLSGSIPDVGGHFDRTSFLGNLGLCGRPLTNACPPPTPEAKKKGSSKKDYLIYSSYAAIGLIVVCLVAFFVMKRGRKQKENGSKVVSKSINDKNSSTSSESKAGRSEFSITSAESGKGSSSLTVLSSPVVNGLKFEDLLRSPAELIGRGRRGSMYKVTVNERLCLAVKRIRDWDISKDEFEKKMKRIDQVKHPNVMPIVAFYCSKQEKLLVYEFQQNGSLFKLLHGSENDKLFDWESRLNVAVKISEALAYMHEGLQADGISHGNLKSSNILLNNAAEPRLSEYGLVETDDSQDQSFPAEMDSLQGNISPITKKNVFKKDTYSFGVILLELLTGKLVQNNGYELARWVNSAIREEWTVEVFDKALVSDGADEEQMVSLLQVAIKCINSSSEARPSMREVAGVIKSIKEQDEKSITSDP